MARNVLEIVLQAIDKASGPLGKVSKATDDLGKSSKKSGTDMKALGATALKVTGTIAAFGFAAKRAFDLAKEGAAVKQTGQSFGFLMNKVGASADIINELRAASKGTISDMDLMSSTATLLAGAQGRLGEKMAQATPQLMSIAKAAQKLNPSLGNTTFLYNSLALGIKRGSPLILDNLGLLVSVKDANVALAASLGKTVAELTAEEQKMALLNETMRAGNVLIAQAGGTTDSATDSYVQLGAAISNLTDIYKVQMHEAMHPFIEALARQAQQATVVTAALRDLRNAQSEGKITQEQYAATVQLMRRGLIDAEDALSTLKEEVVEMPGHMVRIAETTEQAAEGMDRAALKAMNLTINQGLLKVASGEMSQEMMRATIRADNLEKAFLESGAASGHTAAQVQAAKDEVLRLTEAFNYVIPEGHRFGRMFDDMAAGADRALMALGGFSDGVKIVAEETDKWIGYNQDLAVAMGDTTREIIDAENELALMKAQVDDGTVAVGKNDRAMQALEIAIFNMKRELAESSLVIRDNSAALAESARLQQANITLRRAVAIATGAETEEMHRLRDESDAWAETYRNSEGPAKAHALAMHVQTSVALGVSVDAHRQLQRELNATSRAERNLAVSVRDRLAAQGAKIAPGMGIVSAGGALRAATVGDEWEEVHGEWQSGAGGLRQKPHIQKVIKDMVQRHGFDPANPQGWGLDFLASQAGSGLPGGFEASKIAEVLQANAVGAHGLSGIVPSGFPNYSFMIGATSGESVNITPAHMKGSGGGMVINNLYLTGVQTDSQLFDAVTRVARQRGRAFAKVM